MLVYMHTKSLANPVSSRMKKVLVFGIFDILHPGHIEFLKSAKQRGDALVVSVGQDSASRKFKNKTPQHSLKDRIKLVESVKYVSRAVAGDEGQGSYRVLELEMPDVICLGYDQKKLAHDLRRWIKEHGTKTRIVFAKPYKERKYKTTIIQKK